MGYNKLIIDENVLATHFQARENPNGNNMYETNLMPDVIFMKYCVNSRDYFVIIDSLNYLLVSNKKWCKQNEYIGRKENGEAIYLHRVIANITNGQQGHHQKHRFDNRADSLQEVTPATHDRHRAYSDGDLHITMQNIKNIEVLINQ